MDSGTYLYVGFGLSLAFLHQGVSYWDFWYKVVFWPAWLAYWFALTYLPLVPR